MSNEKSVMKIIRAARPSFRNDSDRLAFAVHSFFLAADYVLTATGPDALSENIFSSATDEVGIDNWNHLENEYAFFYVNPEKKSSKLLVKCLVMDGKLNVYALPEGSSEPYNIEINIDDYIGEVGSGNYPAQFKNLEKLVSCLDKELLSKLSGSSSKSSLSANHPSTETGEGSRRNGNGNDSGLRINDPIGPIPHPSGVIIPPINPIGGSDLLPGPGAGMYPRRGDFGGGSMLLGPNDPRWFGGADGEHGFPGAQPGVPPGARFDPYGPPGVPGFEPSRFIRNPRRPGGSTHPDLEHFGGGSDFI